MTNTSTIVDGSVLRLRNAKFGQNHLGAHGALCAYIMITD